MQKNTVSMKIQKHYKLIIKHVLALVYIWILITGWIRLLSVLVQSSVCKQARHRCEACCRCACYRMWSHTVTNLSSAAQTFQTKRLNARETSVQKQHTASPTLNWSYSSCQQILWKKDRTNKYFLCSQSLVHLIPPQLIQHTLSHCRAAVHTHWSVWSVAENSTCIKLFCGIISQQNQKEKWKRPEHIPQFDGSDGAPRWDLTLDV